MYYLNEQINKQLFTSKRPILFFKPGNSVNTATCRVYISTNISKIMFKNQTI